MNTVKRKRLKSLPQLKKHLWRLFSEYIRKRDADENGMVKCFTCTRFSHWKEMQAGHFVAQSLGLWTVFVEHNVHAQCLTRESNVKMFNGTHKSIADLQEGEFVWAFNEEDFSLEKAVIEKSEKFIPALLYEVELENGKKFYATGDHSVVANGKWVSVEGMLHDVSAYDIMEL